LKPLGAKRSVAVFVPVDSLTTTVAPAGNVKVGKVNVLVAKRNR